MTILTHLVDSSSHVNWASPFPYLGVSGLFCLFFVVVVVIYRNSFFQTASPAMTSRNCVASNLGLHFCQGSNYGTPSIKGQRRPELDYACSSCG